MKKYIKYASAILFGTFILMACNDDVKVPGKYDVPEAPTSGTLKALAQARGLKIGNTLSYSDLANQKKLDLIKGEFDNVTFEYEMKHGAIVKNDGSMDFSRADAMVAWAKNNGIGIYGHTLVWYQNQNATYLKTVAAPPATEYYGPNLISNSTMETNIDGYQQINPGPSGSCGPRIDQGDGRNGTKGLHIDGTCDAVTANDYWRVQISTTLTQNMEAGGKYRVEFWIKAKVAGDIQLEIRGGVVDGDGVRYVAPLSVTTDWTKITVEHTALGTETGVITFDVNNANHTEYWIDDVAVYQVLDTPPNLISNATMEDNINGYSQMNPSPSGGCGLRIDQGDGRNGTKGLHIDGTCDAVTANDYWRVQIATTLNQSMIAGTDYSIQFWIKAKAAGDIQLEIRGGVADGDGVRYVAPLSVTTDWTQITVMHTALGTETGVITFDVNNANHTEYWIDDVSVKIYVAGNTGEGPSEEDIAKVDNAMQTWITGCVNHFKGDVHAWDVVNEPMADGVTSGLRTSANSDATGTDIFFWTDFLGRGYALKAFKYAEAADPGALLFINDYNLESNPAKLDSLIAFVAELKAQGAKIDGIGTQMHIADPKNYGAIRDMFQKLAGTGLLIKVSELDVKATVNGTETLAPIDEDFQAAMYGYIVKQYLEIVPKEQQYGITIWGVNDGASWISPREGRYSYFPLLWDDNLARKQSYNAVYKELE